MNMGECSIPNCSGDAQLAYTCNECEHSYCSKHRLPEAHNCSELRRTTDASDAPRFATGLQEKEDKKRGLTRRDKQSGSDRGSSTRTENDDSTDRGESSKPYDTGRGWRSRNTDRTKSATTAGEDSERHSPNVETKSSTVPQPRSGSERVRVNNRLRSFGNSIWSSLQRAASWFWFVLIDFLRLAGAALTIAGGAWMIADVAMVVMSAGLEQVTVVDARAVAAFATGVFLVVVTKR